MAIMITKRTICGSLLVLSFGMSGIATLAQDATPRPTMVSEKTTEPKLKAPPAKPRKVWTDDDVTTLRSPADQYAEQKAAQEAAAKAKAAEESAATSKPATQPAGEPIHKPLHKALVDPKSADDADDMIAWESRDVDAQLDYLRKIQDQLQTASGAERDHLLSEKARMEGVLAQTQQELKILRAQKAELVKPKPQNQ